MANVIGWWSTREGKWHLIESQIDDRLVTRCGRELKLVLGGVSLKSVGQLSPDQMRDRCAYCR